MNGRTDPGLVGAARSPARAAQAVVFYRIAIMSKDGDWIIRESPEACDRGGPEFSEGPQRGAHVSRVRSPRLTQAATRGRHPGAGCSSFSLARLRFV